MTKMNPEIKRRWLEALRSGQYKQGDGYLARVRDGDEETTYCCLGVLCEISVADNVVTKDTVSEEEGSDNYIRYVNKTHLDYDHDEAVYDESSETELPGDVIRWAGLDSSNPIVAGESLATWNDGKHNRIHNTSEPGVDFNQIADLIEEHL